jgi:hypothetical protein
MRRAGCLAVLFGLALAVTAQAQVIVFKGAAAGDLVGLGTTTKMKRSLYVVFSLAGDGMAVIAYGKDADGPHQTLMLFDLAAMPLSPIDLASNTAAARSVVGPNDRTVTTLAFNHRADGDGDSSSLFSAVTGPDSTKPLDTGYPNGQATLMATLPTKLAGFALQADHASNEPTTAYDTTDHETVAGLLKVALKLDLKLLQQLNRDAAVQGQFQDAVEAISDDLAAKGFPVGN